MLVYLKFERFIKRFPDVSLEGCCKPRIGVVHEARISPAIWFKVLVIDSVFIDCDQRVVYWNRDTQEASSFHRTPIDEVDVNSIVRFYFSKEQIFKENELYSFDPDVHELFDTALDIISQYQRDRLSEEEDRVAQKEILKLLHCFVLPAIKFYHHDLTSMNLALDWIGKQLKATEKLIQMKDNSKRNTENSLKKQRERILMSEVFSTGQRIASCDKEFLQCILPHIVKDQKVLNDEYVSLERQKALLMRSDLAEEKDKLVQIREKRDEAFAALNRVITVREDIRNVIHRPHVKKMAVKMKRQEQQPFHDVYVEITSRLQQDSQEIKELILSKVQITSVKEAIRLAIKEVEQEGESYGYHRKAGTSEMETDVFDPQNKPEEWQTLQEKVTTRLQLKPLGYHVKLRDFCELTRNKCQRIMDEAKLFSMESSAQQTNHFSLSLPISPDTARAISSAGHRKSKRTTMIIPENTSMIVPSGSIQLDDIKAMSKDTINHIWDMTRDMAEDVYKDSPRISQMALNKIYICYEAHVSAETMPVLSEIYELHYRNICDTLWVWLQTISLDDIGFNDLHITSMVEPADAQPEPEVEDTMPVDTVKESDNTEVKRPIPSHKGWKTGSLKQMSLKDLYRFVESEGREIPDSFEGALTVDTYSFNNGDYGSGEDEPGDGNGEDATEVLHSPENLNPTSDDEFIVIEDPPSTGTSSEGSRDQADSLQNEVTLRHPFRSTQTSGAQSLLPPSYHEALADRPPDYSHHSAAQEKFFQAFERFTSFLDEEDKACTLFKKLKEIQNAVCYVSQQIEVLREKSGKHEPVSTDDLVSVFVLLLSRLDSDRLHKLYAHLNMVIDLCPKFMQGNASDYALTTFEAALLHLREQSVLQRSSGMNMSV